MTNELEEKMSELEMDNKEHLENVVKETKQKLAAEFAQREENVRGEERAKAREILDEAIKYVALLYLVLIFSNKALLTLRNFMIQKL